MTEHIETDIFTPLLEDIDALINYVRQHEQIKLNLDLLNDRKSFVRERIEKITEEIGEPDAKGHIVVSIDDSVSGVSKVTRQRRVSKNFNSEIAYNILGSKNLQERCMKQVVVLDEEAVMAVYNEGLLTDEDIDAMFPEKIIWATVIK
jgi:hypothetical protein